MKKHEVSAHQGTKTEKIIIWTPSLPFGLFSVLWGSLLIESNLGLCPLGWFNPFIVHPVPLNLIWSSNPVAIILTETLLTALKKKEKKVTTFKDHRKPQRHSDQSQHGVFISYIYWNVWFKISRAVSWCLDLSFLSALYWECQTHFHAKVIQKSDNAWCQRTADTISEPSQDQRQGSGTKKKEDVLQRRWDTTDTNSKSEWVLLW